MQSFSLGELQALHLQGLQVFSAPASIRIAPITLLYGPNSAGKSAVYDALKLLQDAWQPLSSDDAAESWGLAPGPNRFAKLFNDWRRGPGGKPEDAPLRLGISASVESYILFTGEAIGKYGLYEVINNKTPRNLFAELSFAPHSEGLRLTMQIVVDGQALYEYEEGIRVGLNVSHPLLGSRSPLRDYKWSSPVEVDDGWLRLSGPITFDGHWSFDWLAISRALTGGSEDSGLGAAGLSSLVNFQEVNSALVNRWRDVLSRLCEASLVSASRTVPRPEELIYLLDSNFSLTPASAVIMSQGRPEFGRLARAVALQQLVGTPDFELTEDEEEELERAKRVNESLTTNLYTDRGYRLTAEVYRMAALKPNVAFNCEVGNHIVKLMLADEQSRSLEFVNVGSGLGYALPILNALFEGGRIFIQQPELHLHPALQASIADAVIEGIEQGSRLFVETHSEHFLLRLLKRIRQTVDGRGGEHRLSSTDVSVHYFEPSMDGSTKVIELPLSTSGEFTRRWPRGFFVERDQELFGD